MTHLTAVPHHVTAALPCPSCGRLTMARALTVRQEWRSIERGHRCTHCAHEFVSWQAVGIPMPSRGLRIDRDTPQLFIRLAALILRAGAWWARRRG